MTNIEILRHRLQNQQIAETRFTKPEEIVSHLLAMQSQDFAMAKWAIGLRLPGTTEADIDKLFNEGRILRTHLMRPTWHFVTPHDIRWLIEFTAPRVRKIMVPYDKRLGLTQKVFTKSTDVLSRILEGGKVFDRTALRTELAKKKLPLHDNSLSHILMHAELECVICSGPRVGKQFTYMLFDERVPKSKSLKGEDALAELTLRYFAARGPATMQDYMWWSGLNATDAKKGIAMLPRDYVREKIGRKEYIFQPKELKDSKDLQMTFLLPDYDEYGISYKDRDALFNPNGVKGPGRGGHIIFNHMIVIDGIIGGTWQREVKRKSVTVEARLIKGLPQAKDKAVKAAVRRYIQFFGK